MTDRSDVRSEAVERAARTLADEFDYSYVFEQDLRGEMYDAEYWRRLARKMLDAASDITAREDRL